MKGFKDAFKNTKKGFKLLNKKLYEPNAVNSPTGDPSALQSPVSGEDEVDHDIDIGLPENPADDAASEVDQAWSPSSDAQLSVEGALGNFPLESAAANELADDRFSEGSEHLSTNPFFNDDLQGFGDPSLENYGDCDTDIYQESNSTIPAENQYQKDLDPADPTRATLGINTPKRKPPKRAVGYQVEDDPCLVEGERRLIRVAVLANRGARGSAAACERMAEVLGSELAQVEEEIALVRRLLYGTSYSVRKLVDEIPDTIPPHTRPRQNTASTNLQTKGQPCANVLAKIEDEDARFESMLDEEETLWELEALVTEQQYPKAVELIEQSINGVEFSPSLSTNRRQLIDQLCRGLIARAAGRGVATAGITRGGYAAAAGVVYNAREASLLLARLGQARAARRTVLCASSALLQSGIKLAAAGISAKPPAEEFYSRPHEGSTADQVNGICTILRTGLANALENFSAVVEHAQTTTEDGNDSPNPPFRTPPKHQELLNRSDRRTRANADATLEFLTWAVNEIDDAYNQYLVMAFRGCRDLQAVVHAVRVAMEADFGPTGDLANPDNDRSGQKIDADTEGIQIQDNSPHQRLAAVYQSRLLDLMREEIASFLEAERSRLIDLLGSYAADDDGEIHGVRVTTLIGPSFRVEEEEEVEVTTSCLKTCARLREFLESVVVIANDAVYSEVVQCFVHSLEVYRSALIANREAGGSNKMTFSALASYFVPYATDIMEDCLCYPLPEVDMLRRKLERAAGLPMGATSSNNAPSSIPHNTSSGSSSKRSKAKTDNNEPVVWDGEADPEVTRSPSRSNKPSPKPPPGPSRRPARKPPKMTFGSFGESPRSHMMKSKLTHPQRPALKNLQADILPNSEPPSQPLMDLSEDEGSVSRSSVDGGSAGNSEQLGSDNGSTASTNLELVRDKLRKQQLI